MISEPETTKTIDLITEQIRVTAPRATSQGQPEYRATTRTTNRTEHNQSNKRQYTPRHHDPVVILPGRCGPVGKINPGWRHCRGSRLAGPLIPC